MLNKYKNLIIIALIIGVGLIVYSFVKKPATVESMLEVTQNQEGAQVLGDEITAAIEQIQSLKLDDTIFKDPIFVNLIDHSKPIEKQNVGRDNPFAPIGSVNTATRATTTSAIKIDDKTSTSTVKTSSTTIPIR